MKKIFYIGIVSLLAFSGCLPSIIKVPVIMDNNSYDMFGRIPSRNFYFPVTIGDSLVEKWHADVNGGLNNSSVTVHDSYVFVNDLSGWVTCLNLKNGKELGQLKYKGAVYSSPVINNYFLIFIATLNNENYSVLYFYDYRDGTIQSHTNIDDKVLTELIKTKDKIIFNTVKGKVFCFNLNGIKEWETDTKASTHCSPAMENGIIIFGNDEGEIIALNSSDGKIIYRKKVGLSFFGGAAISGETAYIGNDDGNLYAIDLNGGNIKWKYNTDARIISTPVFNNKNIFIGSLNGNLFALEKETGKEIWKAETGGLINATPLLTNNYLLVPDLEGAILFVDPVTGRIAKRFMLENHAKLSPLFIKNTLFIGYDNGIVDAYEIVK